MENRRLLFAVVWTILLIQATRIRSESTESVPTAQITHTDNEYVGKYLPEMWRALKRANADDVHLLQMKKLEKPANNLYQSMKSCIVKYLQAIKPVAFVKLSAESNNSCSVRVVKEHVDILRFASKKSFRCLHLYKIGITNVYADAPQLSVEDQKALDKTFSDCLTELETRAVVDMELLSSKVADCTNEMAGVGPSTTPTSDESDADADENEDDGGNQIEITGQPNNSNRTS